MDHEKLFGLLERIAVSLEAEFDFLRKAFALQEQALDQNKQMYDINQKCLEIYERNVELAEEWQKKMNEKHSSDSTNAFSKAPEGLIGSSLD